MGVIHVIRHGTTSANIKRQYYGKEDLPLTDEGIELITDLTIAKKYPKADGANLYTTGLLRTEQTFFLIYGCKEHGEIPELREYHFGDFEMKTYEELKENPEYQAWITDKQGLTHTPNGESPVEFRERVKRGWGKLLEAHLKPESQDQRTIVICHGGVISAIMGMCFPKAEKNIYQWQPEPGRGYTIHLVEGEPVAYDEI